jgi:hypothetical protein
LKAPVTIVDTSVDYGAYQTAMHLASNSCKGGRGWLEAGCLKKQVTSYKSYASDAFSSVREIKKDKDPPKTGTHVP